MNASFRLLARDLALSLGQWRFWLALGWNDIAKQYRRSFLGPIWITLNTGIFVVAFGMVGAQLFSWDIKSYLPYFAIGHIVFSFFSAVMVESCYVFTQAESYLKHAATPRLAHVFRGVVRNLFTLGHNGLIVLALLIWSGSLASMRVMDFIIGLTMCLIAAVLAMGIIGALCARFRDVPMMVASVMQIMFFLTPVIWRPDQLTERARWLVSLNPFAVFLDLMRLPLLGDPIQWNSFWAAWGVIGALLMTFLPVMAWARGRIVYWL